VKVLGPTSIKATRARVGGVPIGGVMLPRPRARALVPYLFLFPFFAVDAVFLLYPVISALYLSFFDATGLGARKFIGLGNYAALVRDPRYLRALVHTTQYALGSIFLLSPLALLIALAVRSFIVPSQSLKSFYRLAYFLPQLTSFVVIALMFALVFDKDYGLLNNFLAGIGLPRLAWLRSSELAMPSIILVGIWTFVGINSLYFLAGLQGIPEEVNEAAAIDGATRRQILWHVTLPLLRPTILFVLVQATIFSYQLFDLPFLLTEGGPSDASLTVVIYLYQVGFRQFQLGYASAIGYSLAIISILLSTMQLWLFRRWSEP
jgi:ABC-type sugar transport system permease subunit